FSQINGTISNVQNKGNLDKPLLVNLRAVFMNKAAFTTSWNMPMNTKNGSFNVYGHLQKLNLPTLNPALNPLSMIEIKSGNLNSLKYEVIGNDTSSVGYSSFLYDDLKITVLEKEKNDSIGKKKFTSLLANALIKNANKKDEKVPFNYKRDVYK